MVNDFGIIKNIKLEVLVKFVCGGGGWFVY